MIGLMQQRTTATPKGAHQNILNDSQQHTFVRNDPVLHCNMLITLLQQQKFATQKTISNQVQLNIHEMQMKHMHTTLQQAEKK